MEFIDFDGLFDKKLTEYMKKNGGKRTEQEWENLIPDLYRKFGDTYLPKYGCTPRQFYARLSDEELIETLCGHLQNGVPVPEFLCAEAEKRRPAEQILHMLDSADEETALYAVHFIGPDKRAFDKYFCILQNGTAGEDVENEITEALKSAADEVKERALDAYRSARARAEKAEKEKSAEEKEKAERFAEYMLEILSRVTSRDEGIFNALLAAFSADESKIPLRASYLAAYGDERALPVLFKRIENREIGFNEFRELKYAIEALGGEYNEPRSFEHDDDFIKVENQSQKEGFSEIGDLS
ncbi:MAG: hypothetical protein SPH68_06605 [Candidatus Borkfalkiaceae bacterium]|nr:hypothetical protein [Clostridia bacterium]MDY6223808.1 hypothetical protein [Christensenellaceae bacterium]